MLTAVSLICGSRAAAEDAVQDALVRAWERDERRGPLESLPAWVVTVARNAARSSRRRDRAERRALQRLADASPAEAKSWTSPSLAAEVLDVRKAVLGLPTRQREVTVLRYFLGLDVKELAQTLGVSEGTVKASLHQARRSLAAALGAVADEEVDHRG